MTPDAGHGGDHMRGAEPRMDRGELVGKQPVTGHDEEDAGLAEHHHQDDRPQRDNAAMPMRSPIR